MTPTRRINLNHIIHRALIKRALNLIINQDKDQK